MHLLCTLTDRHYTTYCDLQDTVQLQLCQACMHDEEGSIHFHHKSQALPLARDTPWPVQKEHTMTYQGLGRDTTISSSFTVYPVFLLSHIWRYIQECPTPSVRYLGNIPSLHCIYKALLNTFRRCICLTTCRTNKIGKCKWHGQAIPTVNRLMPLAILALTTYRLRKLLYHICQSYMYTPLHFLIVSLLLKQ